MSKILVILGSPDAQSFNAAIFDAYVKNLDRQRHEVQTLKLGEMKFDPVMRYGYRQRMEADAEIERSQELVKWAEKIVFIYPIWWSSMPSLLKGWVDRVLTPGFAYNTKGITSIKHLRGRSADLFMTCDAPAFYYRWITPTPVRLMRQHILGWCGITTRRIQILGKARAISDAQRQKWLDAIAKLAQAA
jgi:putative NADPH-quinone reductase